MNKALSPPAVRSLRFNIRPVLVLAVLFGLTACAPKSYVVLLPSPDGTVGQVTIKGKKGEQVLTSAQQAGSLDGAPLEVEAKQVQQDFGETIAALPKLPVRYLLYFTSGISLNTASDALIPKIIAEARTRPAVDVSVIGHTDTVATSEYNEQLALRRARRVSELLQEKGLNANSLVIESHGKRNLLVQTPDNFYEPKNRRVEVSIR